MSDTTTEQEAQQASQELATEATEAQQAEQQQAAPEGAQQAAEGQEAKAAEKPKGSSTAAHLRARVTEANRRAAEAEAEAGRLRELLAAQGKDTGEAAPDRPQLTQAQIEARAEQIVAERAMAAARKSIISAGVREYGAEVWDEKTSTIHALGAMDQPSFMEALTDLPNAHQVIASLADDLDQLSALLAKRPAAMAAAMGRISAELAVTEQQPRQEISRVPPPVKPVSHGRVAPPPDPAKMTPKEFIEYRNRTAPRHLGGEGKAA